MKFSNLSTLLLGLTAATFVVVSAKNGGKHQHDYFEDDLDETSHQNHNQQPPPQKMCDRDGAIQAQMGLLFGACDVKDAISQIQSIFTNGFAYNMMTQEAGTDAKPYFDEIFNVVCKKKACYESLDQNMYAIQHNCQYEEPEFVREQQQMNKFLKGLRKSPICRKEGFYCGTSFIMAIMDLEQSYMKLSDGKITERMHNDEKLTLVCTSCYADVYNYLIKISEEAGYNIKETLSPLLHFKSNPLSITIEEYHDMCPRVKTSFVDEDMYEAAIKDTKDEENWDDEDV